MGGLAPPPTNRPSTSRSSGWPDRRRELALAAERDRPAHVVRLIGPPAEEPHARDDWLADAGAVDAYGRSGGLSPTGLARERTCGASRRSSGRTSGCSWNPTPSSWTGCLVAGQRLTTGSTSGSRAAMFQQSQIRLSSIRPSVAGGATRAEEPALGAPSDEPLTNRTRHWVSLMSRRSSSPDGVRDAEVAGSNPAFPTTTTLDIPSI